MSDIFYTEVDKNLQTELLARAAAGKKNRTTKDINFMVGKIANVQITPYHVDVTSSNDNKTQVITSKTIIPSAILGGKTTRTTEFLPTGPRGYLGDRKYEIRDERGDSIETTDASDTSKRIPPYLTGVEVQIGDDSMGIMQTSTVNVTIPNPGRDLDYFESIYLRPGRNIRLKIEHPDNAIVSENTNGYLTSGSMPSSEKIKSLYPEITPAEERKYSSMSSYIFDGVIISFTLDYQSDASVAVSLTMRGTSQVYTDLSMAMTDTGKKDKDDVQKTNMIEFFEKIDNDVETQRASSTGNTSNSNIDLGIYVNTTEDRQKDVSYIWGAPFTGRPFKKYISLKALIEFLNKYIITKSTPVVGDVSIVFDRDINVCKYYDRLVSADPNNIFFPGQDKYGTRTWYGTLESTKPKFTDDNVAYPTLIYVAMDYIQTELDSMISAETYTVNEFLKRISTKIYSSSGGAYQLSLITHPEQKNALLYYDNNNVKPFTNVAQPFAIPMFANDPIGTIVRDFSFNGKLPSDASNLAYSLNQDPANITESEIAPFLSYMYSATTVERQENGNETIKNLGSKKLQLEVQKKYEDRHNQYVNELTGSIAAYGNDIDENNAMSRLKTSLKKYIQYPLPTLEQTNQLKAPVIPFDASFTIDGINGFRYGDVVKFNGLPARYTQNTVFSIVSISHSVTTQGEWTTSIQCIMRPSLDF